LQGQAVAVVVDDALVAVGFDVGELFELAVLKLEALGTEALMEGDGEVEGFDGFGQGEVEVQPAAMAGAD
jgi:hypothetical protein